MKCCTFGKLIKCPVRLAKYTDWLNMLNITHLSIRSAVMWQLSCYIWVNDGQPSRDGEQELIPSAAEVFCWRCHHNISTSQFGYLLCALLLVVVGYWRQWERSLLHQHDTSSSHADMPSISRLNQTKDWIKAEWYALCFALKVTEEHWVHDIDCWWSWSTHQLLINVAVHVSFTN